MGTGTGVIDFGAFPGGMDASLVVTGQGGILAGSLVEAWLFPGATPDHTSDEHWIEELRITVPVDSIVPGTGFTVRANATGQSRLYGKYNIGWAWT